jgi:hypothetical protein
MPNSILIDPDGSALLIEPGSYLLYEAEIQPAATRTVIVAARAIE